MKFFCLFFRVVLGMVHLLAVFSHVRCLFIGILIFAYLNLMDIFIFSFVVVFLSTSLFY
jgi:hypothetical protein